MRAFAHVDTWVFDLDHTLYPPEACLFGQIEQRMTDWLVSRLGLDPVTADKKRAAWWASHGTTLSGMMAEYRDADPDDFLDYVHRVDLGHLAPDPALTTGLGRLPGRRIVFTNGSADHADRVLRARGLTDAFDAVYAIEHADYVPKPNRAAFDRVLAMAEVVAGRAAMFEDSPDNLRVPHAMGMATIHVAPERAEGAHIHHHTDDLPAFLSQIG